MTRAELKTAVKYVRRLLVTLADDLGDAAIDEPEVATELNELSDAVTEFEHKLHQFQNK